MRLLLLVGALALASCGDEIPSQKQAERDARDIALVKRANRGVAMPIVPQPILYPEIEKNEIYGTSCAFAPDGGGVGAIAIAMADDGFMKLDDRLVRFAADVGSTALPSGARSKYSGRRYAFELTLSGGEGKRVAAEATTYDGQLTVRASNGDTVYEQTGEIQCGS
jgi:hypothetical protein